MGDKSKFKTPQTSCVPFVGSVQEDLQNLVIFKQRKVIFSCVVNKFLCDQPAEKDHGQQHMSLGDFPK